MSSALFQRYALRGVRADVEDIIVRIQEIRQEFPRLTSGPTSVAAMAAMLEEIDEFTARDGEPVRPAPRPTMAGPSAPTGMMHRSRIRRPSRRKLAGAAKSGAARRWEVARPTLIVLNEMSEPLGIDEASDQLNRLKTEDENPITPGAARWRLNQLVKRGQADLVQESPPLYQITKLGQRCLTQDRDIEEE